MTLVLVAANREFVVQVSDRRLTSLGGVYTEEETKAIYLETPIQQMLLGYTGIARIGRKSMNEVLLDLLHDRVLPKSGLDPSETIHELARSLSAYLRSGPGKAYLPADKRLTVMVTGFLNSPEGWFGPVQALITNYQEWLVEDMPEAWDDFRVEFAECPPEVPPEDANLVQLIGRWGSVNDSDVDAIRKLLAPGKPPGAARDKMATLIAQKAAVDPAIGAQMNSAILRPGSPPIAAYHSAVNSEFVPLLDMVSLAPDGSVMAVRGGEIRSVDGHAMVVANSHRSAPCPCKSGKTYGNCHGRR